MIVYACGASRPYKTKLLDEIPCTLYSLGIAEHDQALCDRWHGIHTVSLHQKEVQQPLDKEQLMCYTVTMKQKRRTEMPVIRITDATWDRLKHWAVPLEDSPEDAVRKVLDAAEEHLKYTQAKASEFKGHNKEKAPKPKRRLPRGQKTPQQAYHCPILEALYELGGIASVGEILKLVEKKMKGLLGTIDYEKLPSGTSIRWQNTAQWARFDLVKEGLLKSDSHPGIWELSDKGLEQVAGAKS